MKRRSNTGHNCGTQFKQLKKQVLENIDLDSVNETTLRRLVDPPSEDRNSKSKYIQRTCQGKSCEEEEGYTQRKLGHSSLSIQGLLPIRVGHGI